MKWLYAIIAGILVSSITAYAAGQTADSGGGAGAVRNEKEADAGQMELDRSHKTFYFNLRKINCPHSVYQGVNGRFRNELPRIPYLRLTPYRDMTVLLKKQGLGTECYEQDCALKSGSAAGMHRVINGSIEQEVINYLEPLGTGKLEYILKKKQTINYMIHVYLYNVENNNEMAHIYRKVSDNELDKAISEIIDDLKKYFKPRPLVRKTARDPIVPTLSWSSTAIIANGKMKRIISASFGFTIEAGLRNIAFNNSLIMVSAGMPAATLRRDRVEAFYTFPFSIIVGYHVPLLNDRLYIAPLAGGGYQVHVIKDVGIGSKRTYCDPLAVFRLELGIECYKNLYVMVHGGYALFFEKTVQGHYAAVGAGLQYFFR
ncbi:MAG TPA: hypothetical protein PKX40_14925 [Spirochaetota bacterium]|nr:hypothetical protein [Spirochaetota bacterium]